MEGGCDIDHFQFTQRTISRRSGFKRGAESDDPSSMLNIALCCLVTGAKIPHFVSESGSQASTKHHRSLPDSSVVEISNPHSNCNFAREEDTTTSLTGLIDRFQSACSSQCQFSSFKMLRDKETDAPCVGNQRGSLSLWPLPCARTSFWNFEKLGCPTEPPAFPAVRAKSQRDTLAVAQTDELQHFFFSTSSTPSTPRSPVTPSSTAAPDRLFTRIGRHRVTPVPLHQHQAHLTNRHCSVDPQLSNRNIFRH